MIKLCKCGCGKPTKICQHTDKKYGVVYGQPNHYLQGHALRRHGHTVRRVNKYGKRRVSPEYSAFQNAKRRCNNPKIWNYYNYGGRGIKFLFTSFDDFISYLGKKPSSHYSLDRYPDKDGNYEIGNVRWATPRQQSLNKRKRYIIRNRLSQFSDKEIQQEFLRRNLNNSLSIQTKT